MTAGALCEPGGIVDHSDIPKPEGDVISGRPGYVRPLFSVIQPAVQAALSSILTLLLGGLTLSFLVVDRWGSTPLGKVVMSKQRICASCVHEPYLVGIISNSDVTDQVCSFCGDLRPTVDVDEILDRCQTVLKDFYSPSSLEENVVAYGEDPDGEPLRDILEYLLGADHDVLKTLEEGLSDRWFDWSSHEHRYGDDPYFIERTQHSSSFGPVWAEMERSLRNEARLVNPKVSETLEHIFGSLHQEVTWRGGGVVVQMGSEEGTGNLYRARVFQDFETLERALYHPARAVGPPPPGFGRANRMNAQGVSVFYGATLSEIAVAEVRPPVGSFVLVGQFTIVRPLRILDLDRLEQVVLSSQQSYFDPKTKDIVARVEFLRSLSKKMVMPVMPERESDGYLITQAIADFLATHPTLSLDGIFFKSVQYQGEDANVGRNIVLFNKASRVEGAEAHADSGIDDVTLFTTDEDGDSLCPVIRMKKDEDIKDGPEEYPWRKDQRVVALRLAFDQLTISEVKGALYKTDDTPIHRSQRLEDRRRSRRSKPIT
jgi:RES domain